MQPTKDINRLFLIVLTLGILTTVVQADESISEKTQATVNDASRAVKKTGNRIKEKLCQQGDVKCAQQKMAHRTVEASQYVKDKAQEIKNKIDTDK